MEYQIHKNLLFHGYSLFPSILRLSISCSVLSTHLKAPHVNRPALSGLHRRLSWQTVGNTKHICRKTYSIFTKFKACIQVSYNSARKFSLQTAPFMPLGEFNSHVIKIFHIPEICHMDRKEKIDNTNKVYVSKNKPLNNIYILVCTHMYMTGFNSV